VLKNVVLISGEETLIQESLDMGTLLDVEDINKTTTPEF